MHSLFIQLHGSVGSSSFLSIVAAISLILCFFFIPWTTDAMVNAAAGLTGKHLGKDKRTLIINCSTNNPELFSMLVSFTLLQAGGIANPLGSNFANIYLMYGCAPVIVIGKWLLTGKSDKVRAFCASLKNEKKLVIWHLASSFGVFTVAAYCYYLLTNSSPFAALTGGGESSAASAPFVPATSDLVLAGGLCVIGVLTFMFFERRLKRQRPELFMDIHDEHHTASWKLFFAGTGGLIIACYIMNTLFLALSELYSAFLTGLMGATVFAGLHYFAGAAITSIPEAKVAIDNYERMTSPDLNTALGSASYSNMTNLSLSGFGILFVIILMAFGVQFKF